MNEQSQDVLPSIFDVTLCQPPSIQVSLSSTIAGEPNLLVQHYHYKTANTFLRLPALQADTIVIPLYGAVNLSGVADQPFALRRVQPGDIFIIPHHTPTEWRWTAAWEALHLYLAPTLLARMAAAVLGLDVLDVKLKIRLGVHDALIHQLGLSLMAELESSGLGTSLYTPALIQVLTLHLLRTHMLFYRNHAVPTGGLTPHALRLVLDYIHSHLAHPLSQSEVAAIVNISPFHFARLFRQSTGQSLHQYIIDQRITAAKRLLLAGGLTLAEIALQVGFADQSHLARHFKRQCGTTPKLFAQARINRQNDRMNIQELEL